jgi:hypothetical protein
MKVGEAARCGICNTDGTIVEINSGNNNKTGYRLSCGDRNAFCDRHQKFVMDASDTHKEIHPMCSDCEYEQMESEASIPKEYQLP